MFLQQVEVLKNRILPVAETLPVQRVGLPHIKALSSQSGQKNFLRLGVEVRMTDFGVKSVLSSYLVPTREKRYNKTYRGALPSEERKRH